VSIAIATDGLLASVSGSVGGGAGSGVAELDGGGRSATTSMAD